MLANDIPDVTTDRTTGRYFSTDVSDDNIGKVKAHIRKTGADSSRGSDDVDYDLILEIPNEDLVKLCNECLKRCDAPSLWLRSIIVGILKNKPEEEPDSYRVICLKSCLLKVLTMIIHQRMSTWAVDNKLIPEWQNGFRAGYRTLNNAFILRCAIDWAKAHHKPLYVALVDATNAFPSTNQDTLWLRLVELGMGGPMFDWLRFVYRRMGYHVRHNNVTSDEFKSLIGLLTGDPASPTLWNLYLSSLKMPPDMDDVILGGLAMDMLAQADDILLLSLSTRGLQ